MKKILMTVAALAAMTVSMSAATMQVTCSGSILMGFGFGTTASTAPAQVCQTFSALGLAGFQLTQSGTSNTSLDYSFDYTGLNAPVGQTPNATLNESFTTSGNPNNPGGATSSSLLSSYRQNSLNYGLDAGAGVTNLTTLLLGNLTNSQVFQAAGAANYSSPNGTTITGASINFKVTYTYEAIPPPSGVPEPSTVALIGAGLVGVASIARRRRS